MSCPRCAFPEPGPVECPRCGVVFARLDRPARATTATQVETPPKSPGSRFSWLDAVLLVGLAASVGLIWSRWAYPPPPRTEVVAVPAHVELDPPTLSMAPSQRETPPDPPPQTAPGLEPAGLGVLPPTPAAGLAAALVPASAFLPEDAAIFQALASVARSGREIESSHVEQAESLHGRYAGVPGVDGLLEEVLELAARQASGRGRLVDAARFRERATELLPGVLAVWMRLVASHQASRSWQEAERAARRGLSAWPDESFFHVALASALSQQGRDDEAADVLRRRLATRQDEMARRELARLEKQLQSVAGLTERSSSHFSIRFEGQADDALGKALLQVLEEKHAMLSRTLDCEPGHEIPVILYPREAFRENSTAPSWAGGYYSHSDGRIRIGTRDLSPGFVPPDLERTLTHEITHAFVHARTRGVIPGDINEGLAQYLSGRRLGYRLDPSRASAHGGQMKVDDYYDSALSFVEYLLDSYRQPAMNDLLKVAGETGNVDQAFRRAYHQSYSETRQEWLKHLR